MKLLLQVISLLCLLLPFACLGQLGGSQNGSILTLPTSAQQMALGTYNITAPCQDVSRQLDNPALLSDSLSGWIQANYQSYFASIQSLSIAYSHTLKSGNIGFAVKQLGFGEFDAYDITGQPVGSFNASDLLMQTTYSHQKGVYRWGASMKLLHSNIELYTSNALLFDLGALFIHPKKDLTVGFTIKNIGISLSEFHQGTNFSAPFDVQAGITFKPERMPLRLSITAHHLHDFDIAYEDSRLLQLQDPLGNPLAEEVSFADKLARHVAIGGEFVLGKILKIQLGYNLLKRRELSLENRPSTTGLSWGLAIQTQKWQLSIARDAFFIGQGVTSFSMAFRPTSLVRQKRVIE